PVAPAPPRPTASVSPTTGPASSGGGSSFRLAPYRLPAPVQREVAVAYGTHVLLAGGLDGSGSSTAGVSSLDPATGKVVRLGSMSSPFHDAAGAMIGGRLFVFGGGASAGSDLVRTFDP